MGHIYLAHTGLTSLGLDHFLVALRYDSIFKLLVKPGHKFEVASDSLVICSSDFSCFRPTRMQQEQGCYLWVSILHLPFLSLKTTYK